MEAVIPTVAVAPSGRCGLHLGTGRGRLSKHRPTLCLWAPHPCPALLTHTGSPATTQGEGSGDRANHLLLRMERNTQKSKRQPRPLSRKPRAIPPHLTTPGSWSPGLQDGPGQLTHPLCVRAHHGGPRAPPAGCVRATPHRGTPAGPRPPCASGRQHPAAGRLLCHTLSSVPPGLWCSALCFSPRSPDETFVPTLQRTEPSPERLRRPGIFAPIFFFLLGNNVKPHRAVAMKTSQPRP